MQITHSIASLLVRERGTFTRPGTAYRSDLLAAFVGTDMMATYKAGTSLDVACASADYMTHGGNDRLTALLALEARDGNTEAAELLARA